jgi:hypothetical protein
MTERAGRPWHFAVAPAGPGPAAPVATGRWPLPGADTPAHRTPSQEIEGDQAAISAQPKVLIRRSLRTVTADFLR